MVKFYTHVIEIIKKKKNAIFTIFMIIIILIVFIGGYFIFQLNNTEVLSTSTPSQQLPGLQTSLPPWSAEINNLKVRLNEIGLPALSQEGTALHTHQHLDIYIHGKHINIPKNIGVNEVAGFISPIHTHDDLNIIHVESPTVQTFTLGQFFDIWGLLFDDKCIGGYCTDSNSKLQVFVNGKETVNNLKNIELSAHQEIVITYGTAKEIPSPIPSSFNFPAGL
jgi:hypothetical protein